MSLRVLPFLIVLLLATSFPGPAVAQQTGPADAPPTEPRPREVPFWTARHIVLVAGVTGAASAGALAWMRERDLRARKSALEALPPGDPANWQSQYNAAAAVMRARNFWTAVAIGVSGATVCYVVTASPQRGFGPSPPGGRPGSWSVGVNPIGPGVTVTHSF